jgi:hypothetical protein
MEDSRHMKRWNVATRLAAIACILVLAACGSDKSASAAADAGVATVNGVVQWSFSEAQLASAPRFTVDSQPVGDTDKASGDSLFNVSSIAKVQLLSDGRFAALDQQRGRLMMFAADGSRLWHAGGLGEEQRRFRYPSGLIRIAGDSLLVPDPPRDSIHWVHPDSGVVRSKGFSGSTALTGIMLRNHVGIVRRRLFASGVRDGPGWSTQDEEGHAIVIAGSSDLAGENVEQITTALGPAVVHVDTLVNGRRFVWNQEPRFSAWPAFAVWDSLVVQSYGPDFRVRVTTIRGKDVAALVLRRPRRPVTEQMRRAAIEAQLAGMLRDLTPRSSDSARWVKFPDSLRLWRAADSVGRRLLMEMRPSEDSLPLFDALLSAPGGVLWVTENGVLGGGTPWSAVAFAPGGRLIGRVTGPGEGEPIAISADRVVVRIRDQKGGVRLRSYRLHSRAASP